MSNFVFSSDERSLPRPSARVVPALLYGGSPPRSGTVCIGSPVLRAVSRLGLEADETAFDLLTIALAVTAGDTFSDRSEAADGWVREISLTIPLHDPGRWGAATPVLQQALNFLSGDNWNIQLTAGGPEAPLPQKRGTKIVSTVGHDCVSLFSGGLDSAVGVLDLVANGKRPLLVSHTYRGDSQRQASIHAKLPGHLSRFGTSLNPRSLLDTPNDVQMRTRSFNFLAFGALAAATMARHGITPGPVTLYVPENGLIALNPPLTPRRIGALSTRTTHYHYLSLIQDILRMVGIPVVLENPYQLSTKGEMMRKCLDQKTLARIAPETVSCGKWKRKRIQCGKCVPCLIRRSSFLASGMKDKTKYGAGNDLNAVLAKASGHDDLLAMMLACQAMPTVNIGQWIAKTGPLPLQRGYRDGLVKVAEKGMKEVRQYLRAEGVPV